MIEFACAFCGLPVQKRRICQRCVLLLPRNDIVCECCGQPLPSRLPDGIPCGACQARPPGFCKARSPYRYTFPVDVALKQLKFGHRTLFAAAFADLLAPVAGAEFADCDVIVPVPLHRQRQWRRGFNQAWEIGRQLGRLWGIPVSMPAIRCRATRSQSGLNAAARRSNVRGAFRLRRPVPGRYPLVVDDVISTGATCDQLARVLREGGADRVGVLTVARSGDA